MVEPPPAIVDCTQADSSNKKRRLSRRDQKARRKKHKRKSNNSSATPVKPVDDPPRLRTIRDIDASSSNSKEEEDDYRASYVSTPIPNMVDEERLDYLSPTNKPNKAGMQKQQQRPTVGVAVKSLGKWFPSAVKLKSTTAPNNTSNIDATASPATCSLLLFYQYVTPPWDNAKMRLLMRYLVQIHQHRHGNLGGRIRISKEGLNATLTSVDLSTSSAAETLRHFAQDLIQFDPAVFTQTDFKYTDQLQADRHFCQLNLLPVKELVYYGLDESMAPLAHGGTHVSPQQFHQYLAGTDDKETVVIDVRNHYEAAIGRFDGQQRLQQDASSNDCSKPKVASYVDPKMRKSTDWASWLAQSETRELLSDKRVLLFCTGGIRCERASAHLNQSYLTSSSTPTTNDTDSDRKATASSSCFAKTNEIPPPAEIFQLQGGIERYLKAFPDGGFWRGKNYVFDKREAVSADNPNGDGGVVHRTQQHMDSLTTEDCVCVACGKPWDRYIGKQHCRCCGVPVLCCDACLSSTITKISTLPLRCPLCVEQNITVPAEDVVYTKNGVAAVSVKPVTNKHDNAKAAPSVCKWGGGHAVEKRRKRRLQSRKCMYGADCQRSDCFFAHPIARSHTPNVKK